jgi:hypothetical protein
MIETGSLGSLVARRVKHRAIARGQGRLRLDALGLHAHPGALDDRHGVVGIVVGDALDVCLEPAQERAQFAARLVARFRGAARPRLRRGLGFLERDDRGLYLRERWDGLGE